MEQLNLLNFIFSLVRRFYVILSTSKIYLQHLNCMVHRIRYFLCISYDLVNLHSTKRFIFTIFYMYVTAFANTANMFHILLVA